MSDPILKPADLKQAWDLSRTIEQNLGDIERDSSVNSQIYSAVATGNTYVDNARRNLNTLRKLLIDDIPDDDPLDKKARDVAPDTTKNIVVALREAKRKLDLIIIGAMGGTAEPCVPVGQFDTSAKSVVDKWVKDNGITQAELQGYTDAQIKDIVSNGFYGKCREVWVQPYVVFLALKTLKAKGQIDWLRVQQIINDNVRELSPYIDATKSKEVVKNWLLAQASRMLRTENKPATDGAITSTAVAIAVSANSDYEGKNLDEIATDIAATEAKYKEMSTALVDTLVVKKASLAMITSVGVGDKTGAKLRAAYTLGVKLKYGLPVWAGGTLNIVSDLSAGFSGVKVKPAGTVQAKRDAELGGVNFKGLTAGLEQELGPVTLSLAVGTRNKEFGFYDMGVEVAFWKMALSLSADYSPYGYAKKDTSERIDHWALRLGLKFLLADKTLVISGTASLEGATDTDLPEEHPNRTVLTPGGEFLIGYDASRKGLLPSAIAAASVSINNSLVTMYYDPADELAVDLEARAGYSWAKANPLWKFIGGVGGKFSFLESAIALYPRQTGSSSGTPPEQIVTDTIILAPYLVINFGGHVFWEISAGAQWDRADIRPKGPSDEGWGPYVGTSLGIQ